MKACTFFGHRDCPQTIQLKLNEVLVDLITNHGVDTFYVGNHGQFDALVRCSLKKIKREYPNITYAVVLAYMPTTPKEYEDYSDTMLPEGIEAVHPRYAISWRNNWMLQHADYVVTYIAHSFSRASKFAQKALLSNKRTFNLYTENI